MYHIDFNVPKTVHFIGIGGISMSGLAEILLDEGFTVSGSDSQASDLTKHLESMGAKVYIGQRAENIGDGIDVVVYTAAIHPDNPEFMAVQAKGIPMLSRAELLGQMMKNYRQALAVAGTHGKTTTTSMLAEIFMAAGTDPTISVGGILDSIGGNIRVGGSRLFLMEACEYTNSFLSFNPTMEIILNIEADHLDFFRDLDDIKRSFRRFAQLVPRDGHIIANADDPGAMDALSDLPLFTFGLDHEADCRGENLTWDQGLPSFDIVIGGKVYASLSLHTAGRHNVLNALAAAAAAYVLGIPGQAVKAGLEAFSGAGRRFEYKGTYNGAKIYDDYAHHPAELHALLTTARSMGFRRVVCAFQPHTYTRTKALFDEFIQELRTADQVVLAEIFAAREKNTIGISSADLAAEIPGSLFCPTLQEVTETLRKIARPGDLILTVGAGDIYTAGEALVKG